MSFFTQIEKNTYISWYLNVSNDSSEAMKTYFLEKQVDAPMFCHFHNARWKKFKMRFIAVVKFTFYYTRTRICFARKEILINVEKQKIVLKE